MIVPREILRRKYDGAGSRGAVLELTARSAGAGASSPRPPSLPGYIRASSRGIDQLLT